MECTPPAATMTILAPPSLNASTCVGTSLFVPSPLP
jgi:hypothetical protein